MSNSGNMKRSNSFHHENIQQQSRPASKSTKESSPAAEPITYRTSDDYYLDEDELFLPIFSTEEEPSEARNGRREERGGVSALDTLVINTTHNVSQKLCLAARVLRRVSAIAEDSDTSLDL